MPKAKKYKREHTNDKTSMFFSDEGSFKKCNVKLKKRVFLLFWKTVKEYTFYLKVGSGEREPRQLSDFEKLQKHLKSL